jgi:hypothetical protein
MKDLPKPNTGLWQAGILEAVSIHHGIAPFLFSLVIFLQLFQLSFAFKLRSADVADIFLNEAKKFPANGNSKKSLLTDLTFHTDERKQRTKIILLFLLTLFN